MIQHLKNEADHGNHSLPRIGESTGKVLVNGSLRSANPCHEKMARTGTFLVLFAQLSTIEFGYESSNKQKTESRS